MSDSDAILREMLKSATDTAQRAFKAGYEEGYRQGYKLCKTREAIAAAKQLVEQQMEKKP